MKIALDALAEENLDALFLLGDYLSMPLFRRRLYIFSDMDLPENTFAVLGNHDYGTGFLSPPNLKFADDVASQLESAGIRVLRNASATIETGKMQVQVVGVDSLWAKKMDLEKAYSDVDPQKPVILLSHTPDVVLNLKDQRSDIILAGHTHGHPVRIPFTNIRVTYTELGRDFNKGEGSFRGRRFYITTGIGSFLLPPRLGIPRESVILHLEL